jgi:hypothetical protein
MILCYVMGVRLSGSTLYEVEKLFRVRNGCEVGDITQWVVLRRINKYRRKSGLARMTLVCT